MRPVDGEEPEQQALQRAEHVGQAPNHRRRDRPRYADRQVDGDEHLREALYRRHRSSSARMGRGPRAALFGPTNTPGCPRYLLPDLRVSVTGVAARA
ncbi:MAG: hypothetical protein AB1425_03290 [Actinomycetota bacterium]